MGPRPPSNFSLNIEDSNLYHFEGVDYSQTPTKSLYLSGLTVAVTEEAIRQVFEEFGELRRVVVSPAHPAGCNPRRSAGLPSRLATDTLFSVLSTPEGTSSVRLTGNSPLVRMNPNPIPGHASKKNTVGGFKD